MTIMKNKIYSAGVALLLFLSGCGDNFLSTDNLYQKGFDNYYRTADDITEALGGIYASLYTDGPHSNEQIAAGLLSDLMLGGGGPDDKSAKNVDKFEDPDEDTYADLWTQTYKGVYRCNAVLENALDADYSLYFESDAEAVEFKAQSLGEAYFMRGFLMFRGAKFFGGMPIIPTTSADRTVPRSTFTETFSAIATDMKAAIEMFPDKAATDYTINDYGHANKWIAEAMLARVYLFYTGYMSNIEGVATTTLPYEGGEMTKADVVAYLDDCMANSGYQMLSDFRNLWPYSYVNESAGTTVLPWAETEGLAWAGQDGIYSTNGTGNTETMFSLRYAYGNWDWDRTQSYTNLTCLYMGIRENVDKVPYGQGWGWGSVHPLLYNSWDEADLRKNGSVLELGNADQGTGDIEARGDHATGYVNKKYTALQHDGEDNIAGLFYYLYNSENHDYQLWHAQDFAYMRYSDVLLMHSELTETADGMNLVRARAGLDPIAYSLADLKMERMHEFAFEGLRWFDLVRWGDVENGSNNFFENEVDVMNSGIEATYSVSYRPETKGLVPVPESEIRLSNGAYEQNPGW